MSDIRVEAGRAAEALEDSPWVAAKDAARILRKIAAMKPVAYITPGGLLDVKAVGKATVFKPGYQPYQDCQALYIHQ